MVGHLVALSAATTAGWTVLQKGDCWAVQLAPQWVELMDKRLVELTDLPTAAPKVVLWD